ncbi:carboxypeptidase-like regulatory domain-containing protein [Paraburkholderia gardini]|uniref:carboxypeptidase-like regulatory domain-containing protein n=1 Tax=Paraburkholderia gardini TaxID=2823469 RepID=UPI001D2AA556|nr:carboxypeptidase-like regulatory domain-containing protein [Paraburkholderia gardini]CAG4893353.1 hypothetical protein R69919_01634 [Paraburkholderia gardini]
MNIQITRFSRPALASSCAALLATLTACGGGGDGGVSAGTAAATPVNMTVSGTAASGKPLAGATISASCVRGSASASADANGQFSLTLSAVPPCLITATAGGTPFHSVAFAGGTFNVTPETDLLLGYLGGQLGTNEMGLLTGFAGNARFQQVLGNQTDVLDAQTAVVSSLQQRFALTLSVPDFLTTPFVPDNEGLDHDLDALQAAGAIDDGGAQSATLSFVTAAGAAQPLPATSPGTTAGGGTGNAGSANSGGMM